MMPCAFIQQVETTREAITSKVIKFSYRKKKIKPGVNFVYKHENSFKQKCILVITN